MTRDHDTTQAPAKRRTKPSSAPKAALTAETVADATDTAGSEGERIAKLMARAGLCSRRDAEDWIAAGRVSVNGAVLTTPAVIVKPGDRVIVDGKPLPTKERTRLFLYHKPKGLVTTSRDPEGRPTVFERLPDDMPRVISVGRLDINTEGLLLLTNDGGLARALELPSTGWLRRYRVRAFGQVTAEQLSGLTDGVTIDGIAYGPVEASIDTVTGSNVWLFVALREGKNREVKRILEHLGLVVNRLIRISFGPFQLADLEEGEIREIRGRVLRDQLGKRLVEQSGADFDAPIVHHLHGDEAPTAKGGKAREPGEPTAKPKRRSARAEKLEFIGTSEDGSREARITRAGKPPVAVTILPSKREERPARPARGRPAGGKFGGSGERSDAGERRGGKPGGPKGPPRGRRDDAGSGRGDRDERPMRSEGFRGRAGAETESGKPYRTRSEGFRSHEGPARTRPNSADGEGKPQRRGPRPEPFGGEDRRGGERPNRRPARETSEDRPASRVARGPRAEAGDRPMRSEGFRGRSQDGEAGAKPYRPRSEGFRDREGGGDKGGRGKAAGFRGRPEGGLAPRSRDGDRPREARDDRPRSERPFADKPRDDRPRGDRPSADKPHGGKHPGGDRPRSGPSKGAPDRGGPGKGGRPGKGRQ